MDRREFLKLAAWSGLAIVTPNVASAEGDAPQVPLYEGPFFVMIKAVGGWDPTYLCDPKGTDINKKYGAGDILTAGKIKYAPGLKNVTGGQSFFEKYRRDLLVLNGLDMATNSHTSGRRYTWTGRLDNAGYPTFPALVSAAKSPASALSYLSFGGYDATGKVIPLSRIVDPKDLDALSSPFHINGDDTRPYFSDYARDRIAQAQREREQMLHEREHLPRLKHAMSTLFTARLSAQELKRVREHLPAEIPGDRLKAQIAIALAAYKAGLCVSVNIMRGGFDTHNNHDDTHLPRLENLLAAADYLMERADQLGVREQLIVAIGSDFSRTPRYNGSNGKDHWSVGSMMLMGRGITGNRVIGATDGGQRARKIDPATLALSSEESAIKLSPEHVHVALRRLAGIQEHELTRRFAIEAEALPLFEGPA